jgi:hypothetical protein
VKQFILTKEKSHKMNNTISRGQHVVNEALKVFPDDTVMRIVHYCREATLDGVLNPHWSPRAITPFIVGPAGYGKTSKLREYARKMNIGYRERKLGGIVDIAEVLGMYRTDLATGNTILARPDWWPDETKEPEGVIVFDDATRALPHILQGIMQLAIDRDYNDLILPEGWSFVFTGNPEEGYNVTATDDAQKSRFLMLNYSRPNEVFYEQLELQAVDSDLKNMWMKDPSMCECPKVEITKPTDNDRTKMIFARIYGFLKYDEAALQHAANTMFGTGWLAKLLAMKKEHQPLEPLDILDNLPEHRHRIREYTENMRNDAIALTVMRLTTFMCTREPGEFTNEQYKNLCDFGMLLSDSDFALIITRLMMHKTHASEFSNRLTAVTRTKEDNGAFTQRFLELRKQIDRKLKGT